MKNKTFLAVIAILAAVMFSAVKGYSATETQSATVVGGTIETLTFQGGSNYDSFRLEANVPDGSGWTILNVSLSGASGWTPGHNSSSAWATAPYPNGDPAKAVELFSVIIQGDIVKATGGSGGEVPRYWVRGIMFGNLIIDPALLSVICGADASYTAKMVEVPTACNWKVIPNGGGMQIASSSAPTSTYTYTANVPGIYKIEAVKDLGTAYAFAYLYVTGVKSVSAEGVTSTTDTPGDDETVYVAQGESGSSVTVTAEPEPGDWPENYPTWTGVTGTPGSATVAVPTTTAGETTVKAVCGTSEKGIKITTVKLNKLQYKTSGGSYEDVSDTIVLKRSLSSLSFKALPSPAESKWPSNKPAWEGAAADTDPTTSTFSLNKDPASYTVQAECGNTLSADIDIVETSFVENSNQNYGYDNYSTGGPYKSVKNEGSDTFYLTATPSRAISSTSLESSATDKVEVSPATPSSQTVTVTGIAKGTASIKSKIGADELATISVKSYNRRDVGVAVRLVHEQATQDLDSGYTSTDISTATITTVLRKVFKQGVLSVVVVRLPAMTVEFDEDHNGKIDANEWGTAELQAVIDQCKDDDYEYNIFIIDNAEGAAGIMGLNQRYGFVFNQDPYTIAHELGHGMGLQHVANDTDNLMWVGLSPFSSWRLRKFQWDIINQE